MYQSQSKKYELAVNFLYMPLDELDVYYDLQNIKKILLLIIYIIFEIINHPQKRKKKKKNLS
ncbi:hypothetical protein C923_01273 [Plasmodium falciparum UGT5.1]|uniref:Uncharacterized protein n=2 Tax=Plasmodium falciparum TaxID=5833 RepID=W7K2A6_PLAFA|nr:hypothetical protein PFBG_01174 [Plasmodium falciparum 7G8]EWC78061.1 hypothetical protein C923_01273 [Plasmodium falciparum UGT5.1]